MNKNVARAIVETLNAYRVCKNREDVLSKEWEFKHLEILKKVCKYYLPHGSGIDSTVNDPFNGLILETTDSSKICIGISYHHMNDAGYYIRWTDHIIVAKPTFSEMDIKVSGRDYNGIKEYLAEEYYNALSVMIPDSFFV